MPAGADLGRSRSGVPVQRRLRDQATLTLGFNGFAPLQVAWAGRPDGAPPMDDTVRVRRIADGIGTPSWRWSGTPTAVLACRRAGRRRSPGRRRRRARASSWTSAPHGRLRAGPPYPLHRYLDLERAEETATAFPPGNLHLHDIVAEPGLRRRGLARHLPHHLYRHRPHARGRADLSWSPSAHGAFWSARGFVPQPGVVAAGDYGADAVYMSRPVPAAPLPSSPARVPRPRPCARSELMRVSRPHDPFLRGQLAIAALFLSSASRRHLGRPDSGRQGRLRT